MTTPGVTLFVVEGEIPARDHLDAHRAEITGARQALARVVVVRGVVRVAADVHHQGVFGSWPQREIERRSDAGHAGEPAEPIEQID